MLVFEGVFKREEAEMLDENWNADNDELVCVPVAASSLSGGPSDVDSDDLSEESTCVVKKNDTLQ